LAPLLAVHRSHLHPVQALWDAGIDILGLAHITGGGIVEIYRSSARKHRRRYHRGTWPEQPIFGYIQTHSYVSNAEMLRVFNMGLGMLAVMPARDAERAKSVLSNDCYLVGEVVPGNKTITIEGL
jgi:phosphoribosylformylglycinamidine cyclo-ligase